MQEVDCDSVDAIVGAAPDPSGITVVVRGSKKYCCMQCHGDAWLSPQSQLLLKRRPEVKVYCFTCIKKKKVKDKDGKLPETCRPSREMIAADLGEEIADLIVKEDLDPTKS